MYKKEIAALTEELARVKERSKAARQDFEAELAKLRNSLERRELESRQDLETELAELRDSLAKRELEQVELKKDLDEERDLRKQLETDANELLVSFLLTDYPGVSPSEPMAIVQKPIIQVDNPSIPNGTYIIKNRTGNNYWTAKVRPSGIMRTVDFWTSKKDATDYSYTQVNEHSPMIIQMLKE